MVVWPVSPRSARAGAGRRAVGQRRTGLHQGRVRDAAIGHQDDEAGAHAQRHDGAVPSHKVLDRVPLPVAEQRHGQWAWRETAAVLAFPGPGPVLREQEEDEWEEEGDEDQERW
jgi:hypothetical protein